MCFLSRHIRNIYNFRKRRCFIFLLVVSLCAVVIALLSSNQRNLPKRNFYSRDHMTKERTRDRRKIQSGFSVVEHIPVGQLHSYGDNNTLKRADNFTLKRLQNIFNFKGRVRADRFGAPPEYTKKELWGCYNYKEGQLALSRKRADNDTLVRLSCGKRLPAAWIIGVKKCGSQMLSALLDLHPQVVSSVSSIYVEESDEKWLDKRVFIQTQLPLTTPDEIAIYDMVGLQNRHRALRHVVENLTTADSLFLLILTDPVKRALSDYAHCAAKIKSSKNEGNYHVGKQLVWHVRTQRSSLEPVAHFKGYRIAKTFEKSVLNSSGKVDVDNPLVNKGFYADYIEEIFKIIPKEKVLIVDGKEFVSAPWDIMHRVEVFLNLSRFFSRKHFRKNGDFFCPVLKERPDAGCLRGKGRSKPKVDATVLRKLYNFYRPFNRRLKTLANIDFSWM